MSACYSASPLPSRPTDGAPVQLHSGTNTVTKLHDLVRYKTNKNFDRKKTAVIFDDGVRKKTASYEEMENFEKKVTASLSSYCGETVGLYLETSTNVPAFLLGVLCAGCAFYSIGEDVPTRLLLQILTKHNIRVVLGNSINKLQELSAQLSSVHPVIVSHNAVHQLSLPDIPVKKLRHPVAYMITTSGTTGVPKVVKVSHMCIVPNIQHLKDIYQLTSNDLIFQASPLTFDPSIVEVFLSLYTGACLLLTSLSVKLQPRSLTTVLTHRNKATVIQATPTLLSPIASDLLSASSCVRVLAFGGEVCPPGVTLRRWQEAGNRTRVLSLYGITEVSCWATWQEVTLTEEDDGWHPGSIPLGSALKGTKLMIKDENGEEAKEGELFIGGEQRVCLIDDEEFPAVVKGRRSGDLVRLDRQNKLWYMGRADHQIKRNGKRVNPQQIETVLSECPHVNQGVVLCHNSSIFVVFTSHHDHHQIDNSISETKVDSDDTIAAYSHNMKQTTQEGHQQALDKTRAVSDSSEQTILESPDRVYGKESPDKVYRNKLREDTNKIIAQVKTYLGSNLPVYCLPNKMFCTQSLPMTAHGKVDRKLLFEQMLPFFLQSSKQLDDVDEAKLMEMNRNESTVGPGVKQNARALVLSFCEEHLCKPLDLCLRFVDQGGTSFQAVALMEHLLAQLQVQVQQVPDLIDIILTHTLSEVITYVEQRMTPLSCETTVDTEEKDLRQNGNIEMDTQKLKVKHKDSATEQEHPVITEQEDSVGEQEYTGVERLKLEKVWEFDMGKCVDASPFIIFSDRGTFVYIGSHSGMVCCLELETSRCEWSRLLPDRVESSACASKCGKYVTVGCYDQKLYVLCAVTGCTVWSHCTRGTVRCSPCTDPRTGLVLCGSHDGSMYALDVLAQQCVWQTDLHSLSILASPCVCPSLHVVYIATLGGTLAALSVSSGAKVWSVNLGRPLFSTPMLINAGVCVGCVDGCLYAYSQEGQQLWKQKLGAEIFSSPSLSFIQPDSGSTHKEKTSSGSGDTKHPPQSLDSLQPSIVVSSQDNKSGEHCVHCMDMDGRLIWNRKMKNRVYSTCFYVNNVDHVDGGDTLQTNRMAISETVRHDKGRETTNCIHLDDDKRKETKSKDLCEINDIDTSVEMSDTDLKTMNRKRGINLVDINDVKEKKLRITDQANEANQKTEKLDAGRKPPIKTSPRDVTLNISPKSESSVAAVRQRATGFVVVCSTAGEVCIVDACTGALCAQLSLPFEVFSSPVCHDGRIVVGCRNNKVYCMSVDSNSV